MSDYLLIGITLISGFLIVYHHVGYPLILKLLKNDSALSTMPITGRYYTAAVSDQEFPTISIVIPAYNEQDWIAEKIRNLATLDYPDEKLSIVIACDGCTDKTAAVAREIITEPEIQHLDIKINEYEINSGKVAVLNRVMETIDSDLVALSDVSALISVDALLVAAQRFSDPALGVLNGHYQLLNPGSVGEAAYWRYQSNIKSREALLGSTIGSHGAFYVFRTKLFQPLPADTINDDFILPMQIVAAGYRSDYDERINALELEQACDQQDHQRRRRIAAGNAQQLIRLKQLLSPRYKGTAVAFISGKALRVLMPFLMIINLICCALLAVDNFLFFMLTVLQMAAYLTGGYYSLIKPDIANPILQKLAYLVKGHTAGLIGTIRYLFGFEKGRWKRFN